MLETQMKALRFARLTGWEKGKNQGYFPTQILHMVTDGALPEKLHKEKYFKLNQNK